MAYVRIIISPIGETKVEAVGYEGPLCSTKTDPYIKALGIKTSDVPKPEMFVTNTQIQEVNQ